MSVSRLVTSVTGNAGTKNGVEEEKSLARSVSRLYNGRLGSPLYSYGWERM